MHKTIGPYTKLSPAELLEAARRAGRRIVLIVDDWNKCAAASQRDLSSDLAGFRLRYGARLIIASQDRPADALFDSFKVVMLAPLRTEQKKQIFSYYAGDHGAAWDSEFSGAFATAYDLSVAGRSCSGVSTTSTRCELYDLYTRQKLPSASARVIVRQLAWFMGESFKPCLHASEYERISEKFAMDLGTPLTVIDDILKSGLMVAASNTIAFEHELLREFFRSEFLVRDSRGQLVTQKLAEPRYANLAEFVIPKITDETVLNPYLALADSHLLSMGFRGNLGERAKKIIRQQCHDLLQKTRDGLPEVKVDLFIGELDNGRKALYSAHIAPDSSASSINERLCTVIVDNLDDPELRGAFLELLDLGEWALKAAASDAAAANGIKPLAVWRELIRLNVILGHSGPVHPVLLMCRGLRANQQFRKSKSYSSLRAFLLERVRARTCGSLGQLLLLAALDQWDDIAVDDVAELFSQVWQSGIEIVQMEALSSLHACASTLCKQGPEAEGRIVELLDGANVRKNIFLSTQWLETRSSFAGYNCGLTTDDALKEYQRILLAAETGADPLWELEREYNPESTFTAFMSSYASSALSKIFEDIFEGIYYEAYELLSPEERQRILTLALQDERSDLFRAWYLRELTKLGCDSARDIVAGIGSRIDVDNFCPQEAVETFVVANEAWAGISEEPLRYGVASSEVRVWAIAGELVFWLHHSSAPKDAASRIKALLLELTESPAAVPDVFRYLSPALFMGRPHAAPFALLLSNYTEEIRTLLNLCLEHEGRFTSAFRGAEHRQCELFDWVVSTLAEIGDDTSINNLRVWTGHPMYGTGVIKAIECIARRCVSAGYL